MPETHPRGPTHPHALPGGPGGCAQHQKLGVKQMVPAAWGGGVPCAATSPPSAKTKARVNRPIDVCDFISASLTVTILAQTVKNFDRVTPGILGLCQATTTLARPNGVGALRYLAAITR